MITIMETKKIVNNKELVDIACLSTDTKPTTGIMNGSMLIETDTGKVCIYNEADEEWTEIGSGGGGGGGVTVEALNVTENGTYSEEGKAYSPVVVNVAGGSSDFSTASVVITNNMAENPLIIEELTCVDEGGLINGTAIEAGQSSTISVVLYKNIPTYGHQNRVAIVSVTGDIVYDSGDVYVSGDGTITVTDDK